MWSVPQPRYTVQETYEAAISKIRDPHLHGACRTATGEVTRAGAVYAAAAARGAAHALSEDSFTVAGVTREQMIWLYDARMAHKRGPARYVYDAIRTAAPFNRCPMCGHRDVGTLDHVMPKTKFLALAVTPLNLVPACHECNKKKGNQVAATAHTAAVHPYYDDFDKDCWLKAAVVQGHPPAVRFFVQPPSRWSAADQDRSRRHFDEYALGALFTAQAAQQLVSLSYRLASLAETAGPAGVESYLLDEADSYRRARLNSWQTAMFTALAASEWYRGGGFKV